MNILVFKFSNSNTSNASDANTFTVTTYDYLHKRPWMPGLSNKDSYVLSLCMNNVTDYRYLYTRRCIFSKSCGFLA
jgi:hypothetical protein